MAISLARQRRRYLKTQLAPQTGTHTQAGLNTHQIETSGWNPFLSVK